jgi:hypothetical protein
MLMLNAEEGMCYIGILRASEDASNHRSNHSKEQGIQDKQHFPLYETATRRMDIWSTLSRKTSRPNAV